MGAIEFGKELDLGRNHASSLCTAAKRRGYLSKDSSLSPWKTAALKVELDNTIMLLR